MIQQQSLAGRLVIGQQVPPLVARSSTVRRPTTGPSGSRKTGSQATHPREDLTLSRQVSNVTPARFALFTQRALSANHSRNSQTMNIVLTSGILAISIDLELDVQRR
ncbi:MAG TPA: hypothetical protein VGG30_06900, partial [Pirellulales bacterium]